ncbi:hypothetical protein CYMTET_34423, partial [Cymbomonas tetramitiformis]
MVTAQKYGCRLFSSVTAVPLWRGARRAYVSAQASTSPRGGLLLPCHSRRPTSIRGVQRTCKLGRGLATTLFQVFAPRNQRLSYRRTRSHVRRGTTLITFASSNQTVAEHNNAQAVAGALELGFILLLVLASNLNTGEEAWQVAAFTLVEFVYIGLHVRPLAPLLQGQKDAGSGTDELWMRCFTSSHFFLSECSLLTLLAFASPLSSTLPRLAVCTHLGFHILYLTLTVLFPAWCVRQNVERVEMRQQTQGDDMSFERLSQWVWSSGLNVLNAADASMHVFYASLLVSKMPLETVPPTLCAAGAGFMLLSEWAPQLDARPSIKGACIVDDVA